MAYDPGLGMVASRIQAFQNGWATQSRSTAQSGREPLHDSNFHSMSRRVNVSSTQDEGPTIHVANTERQQDAPLPPEHIGGAATAAILHSRAQSSNTPGRSVSTSSATDFNPPPQDFFLDHHPQKCRPTRTKTSPESPFNPEHRLSEARARLRCISQVTTDAAASPLKEEIVSPLPRKNSLDDLQSLIEEAIDEQAPADLVSTPSQPSKRLNTMALRSEKTPSRPVTTDLTPGSSSKSPMPSARRIRCCGVHRTSTPLPVEPRDNDVSSPSSPGSQLTSPTRSASLSKPPAPPRGKVGPGPRASMKNVSIRLSPRLQPHRDTVRPSSILHVQRPVKDRAAAFESMLHRENEPETSEPRVYDQDVPASKQWRSNSMARRPSPNVKAPLKDKPNAVEPSLGQELTMTAFTNTQPADPGIGQGAIPLASPHLLSSNGRAASASTQFEGCLEPKLGSEAPLSRPSPSTVPKTAGLCDAQRESRAPPLRWKTPQIGRGLSPSEARPMSPTESGREASGYFSIPQVVAQTPETARQPVEKYDPQMSVIFQNIPKERLPTSQTSPLITETIELRAEKQASMTSFETPYPSEVQPSPLLSQYNTTSTMKGCEQEGFGADAGTGARVQGAVPHIAGPKGIGSQPCSTRGSRSSPHRTDNRQHNPPSTVNSCIPSASESGSPPRGRTSSRMPLRGRSIVTPRDDGGSALGVGRSTSRTGNFKVTVEVRTPPGTPSKSGGAASGNGDATNGHGVGEQRVVVVTTDVEAVEERDHSVSDSHSICSSTR